LHTYTLPLCYCGNVNLPYLRGSLLLFICTNTHHGVTWRNIAVCVLFLVTAAGPLLRPFRTYTGLVRR